MLRPAADQFSLAEGCLDQKRESAAGETCAPIDVGGMTERMKLTHQLPMSCIVYALVVVRDEQGATIEQG